MKLCSGFFSTGDGNIPGNYGIWDMIQALKFLQEILPSFNGDPKNVTIFGHSAGGMATSLLTLTPETKDLFARAIPLSGSALSKSSNNPFLIKHSKMIAEALGIDFSSFRLRDEIIEVSADQIKEAVKSFIPEMLRVDEVVLVHFSPRIDGDLFKEKTAVELVYKSDVSKPILMGLVDQEAILFAVNPFGKLATSGKYIWIHPDDIPNVDKTRFSDYVNQKLADKNIFGSSAEDYANAVINFYETNVKVSNNRYLTMLTQLISDVNFNIPALREAKARATAGQKVYFYLYTYVNPKYKSKYFDAVAHADELPNLFDAPVGKQNIELEGEEGNVQKKFAELFVNFARNGYVFLRVI
jgi:carboxylesterase type B